jgi:two-component system, sensor histidine kinase YesM
MKPGMYRSLRAQMLINIFGVFLLLVISTSYLLFATTRVQETVNDSFEKQRYIREVQDQLAEFQGLLLEYLSTRSSDALSDILVLTQKIRAEIPQYERVPADPVSLRETEVYSLVASYLDLGDTAIEQKRGMNVDSYTSLYNQMEQLHGYINREIESLSSSRFSDQLADYEVLIKKSRSMQQWNLFFIVCISVFSLILILHTVEKINKPLVNLSRMAGEISVGNFAGEDVGKTSLVEVDRAIDAFNRMRHDLSTYIDELKWQRNVEQEYMQERVKNMKMEETLRRMELYTLQAQMNPHFLFNTLNTGIQLAIVEGAERTGDYMDHLARLLRNNLREKNVFVSLRHEIEGLEDYFYILGVRFPKNLDLALDCPATILDQYKVPSYILQPLVENCVVHAFTWNKDRNSIVVRVHVEESMLCLSVADNGVGMKQELIDSLLSPETNDGTRSKVMGLENVIQRLRFFFPNDADVIEIRATPGEGTEVSIRINTGRDLCIPS